MDEKKKVVKIKVSKPVNSEKVSKTDSIIDTEQLKKRMSEQKAAAENTGSQEPDFVLVSDSETQKEEKSSNDVIHVDLIPQVLCPRCGATVNADSTFCPTCGQEINQPAVCSKCGAELAPEMQFCPNCGASTKPETSKKDGFNFKDLDNATIKKYLPIALIAILAIALIAVIATRPSNDSDTSSSDSEIVYDEDDFEGYSSNKLYDAYYAVDGSSLGTGVMLSSDNRSITVDTKPSDYSASESSILRAIVELNEYLDLPDSLLSRMDTTRAIDGTQTATYGDITVTWNYHPDNGLNIIYELTS